MNDGTGAENVRAMFESAEEFPPPEAYEEDAPEAGGPRWRRAEGPPWTLPEDCPVEPLGIAGDVCYYLDANRQLRAVKAKDHSKLNVAFLFGRWTAYLYGVWPRLKQEKESGKWYVTGWMNEAASEALMRACALRGVWDVMGRVRGPGAWAAPDGGLVFHCGDAVWTGAGAANGAGIYAEPGLFGQLVYPSGMAGPRPHAEPQPDGEDGPGWELLELYKSWSWRRGETDARLLLGWTGAAMLGGALRWRPMCWLTGDLATGKSTLHDVIHGVVGAVIQSSEATAAGIWQKVGHASLPVALDEVEAREDNRKVQAVIELARQAASGGVILRGGQDHTGAEFTARNCFLFSSILIPPLAPQDMSRMAILDLGPLESVTPPDLNPERLALLGRRLRRRLADQWQSFPARLERWRQQLAAIGHKGRGADQFGTLLAVADALLFDELPDREADEADRLGEWTRPLAADLLAAHDNNDSDHKLCIQHMLTSPADAWKGGAKDPVGVYIRRAAQLDPNTSLQTVADADDTLGRIGLKVVNEPALEDGPHVAWLAVANTHQGLAQLFRDTQWAARAGKSSVWMQAMRRVEYRPKNGPAIRARASSRSFNGIGCRCTLVPLAAIFPDDFSEGEA